MSLRHALDLAIVRVRMPPNQRAACCGRHLERRLADRSAEGLDGAIRLELLRGAKERLRTTVLPADFLPRLEKLREHRHLRRIARNPFLQLVAGRLEPPFGRYAEGANRALEAGDGAH